MYQYHYIVGKGGLPFAQLSTLEISAVSVRLNRVFLIASIFKDSLLAFRTHNLLHHLSDISAANN